MTIRQAFYRPVFRSSLIGRLFPVVVVALSSLIAGVCAASIYGHATIVTVVTAPPHRGDLTALSVKPLQYADLHLSSPTAVPAVTETMKVGCDLPERMTAARHLLVPIPLSVGAKKYSYVENRAGFVVNFSEPEKKIALALMDDDSCELQTTTISQRGDVLIADNGYDIEPVMRSNGIRWNNWATEFRVIRPQHQTVVALKYPYLDDVPVSGTRGNAIVPIYYTPYSQEIHVPELVRSGEEYLQGLASRAFDDLRARRVPSEAIPGARVVDVSVIRPEFIARLAPIEHMDMTEFLLDPAWTTERIHIVIGANQERVATYTCSNAGACGLMQFTEGTYNMMRDMYPSARLIPKFEEGARNQLNAMKAAILLEDYNTALLVASFGREIIHDGKLEEYLAAAYNTGAGRVIAVLSVAKNEKIADWADAAGPGDNEQLLNETKGYIAKLRFLRDDWRPKPLAKAMK